MGENAVFMWNTTDGKRILSAIWGLRNGEMADPQFINVNALQLTAGKVHFNTNLTQQYVGRIDFIGNLTAGHAWFILKNLNINDTNEYIARISDISDVSGVLSYPVHLIVKDKGK